MTSKTWLTFDEQETKGRITRLWHVRSTTSGTMLGSVGWYSPWRQYTFFTLGRDSILNVDCMVEIASFCTNQTELHRAGLNRLVEAVRDVDAE